MIDPDECPVLFESVKKWRRKNGHPDKRSVHAHASDGMSYLNWRTYPRKIVSREISYKRLKGRKRARQMKGF